jgi:hypothetical protein
VNSPVTYIPSDFAGALLSVLRIETLVTIAMEKMMNISTIRVFDITEEDDDLRLLYSSIPNENTKSFSINQIKHVVAVNGELWYCEVVGVADRDWSVCLSSNPSFSRNTSKAQQIVVLVCCPIATLFIMLVTVVIVLWLYGRKQVHSVMKHKVLLLEQLMPRKYVEKIIRGEHNVAEIQRNVAILFMDIVGFTAFSSSITPKELIKFLNEFFFIVDAVIERHQLEKIKTIGDCYMVTTPVGQNIGTGSARDNAHKITYFALEVNDMCQHCKMGNDPIQFRIGIHIGDVICGVIGKTKCK